MPVLEQFVSDPSPEVSQVIRSRRGERPPNDGLRCVRDGKVDQVPFLPRDNGAPSPCLCRHTVRLEGRRGAGSWTVRSLASASWPNSDSRRGHVPSVQPPHSRANQTARFMKSDARTRYLPPAMGTKVEPRCAARLERLDDCRGRSWHGACGGYVWHSLASGSWVHR